MRGWSEAEIPDQTGKTALVTGANSGLGLRTAQVLAGMGARVVMACRSLDRGQAAAERVGRNAEVLELDLADLASVRKAAAEARDRTGDKIDVLVNNAGVFATPHKRTADGFELQFGTNHLGHAALTWLLMPALRDGGRVVTVASPMARSTHIDLSDPNFERRPYSMSAAYRQSKLANLLFAFELDRRARKAGIGLISTAAHPGTAATDLVANSTSLRQPIPVISAVLNWGMHALLQSVENAALPQLYAATAPDVRGGDYFAPTHLMNLWGPPTRIQPSPAVLNPTTATHLWHLTATLTGTTPDPS
ncbi:oxidoreductase [Actinocrispum sp. NPDC049592]|uniref:oxidoreductase n=1 Tax=Actinocrispum sp. NPDC049592 TaxID=3154835 RepID=UPI00342A5205